MTSATMKVKLVNLLHLIVAWLLGSAFFAILLFPNKVFAQEVQLEVHTFSSTITLVVDEAEVPSWEALSTKMLEYCADRVDLGDVQEFFDCSSVPHALTYGSHWFWGSSIHQLSVGGFFWFFSDLSYDADPQKKGDHTHEGG